jgi:D-alanine transaminase
VTVLKKVYYNGQFYEPSEVKIPLTDRAIWFGDGVYDAAIGKNQKIYMLSEHIERLMGNARRMDIPLFCSPCEIQKILTDLALGQEDVFLYFQLSRYSEGRSHSYSDTNRSNLLITATEITLPATETTLRLISARDVRYELCDVKTLNLLPSVLASKNAARHGADETVFIRSGFVTECSHSNISIIKNGSLITHPADEHILPGTARASLLRCARRMGIPVRERAFDYNELISADDVLVTSSSKLCLRAESVDGFPIRLNKFGVGIELCRAMRTEYEEATS